MNRRHFLASTAATIASTVMLRSASAAAPVSTTAPAVPPNLAWKDVREWGVEGRAFDDTENYFDRLPARAKDFVREPVWDLARNTAGMSVRFETDAQDIFVRYTLTSDRLAMAHMPATGVSGVDLYVLDQNKWRWAANVKPATQTVGASLIRNMAEGSRKCLINFPLYNGLKSFEIGVPRRAAFAGTPPRKDKPVLFYGTSITQGGCASRPGLAFTNILGRRLDRPMLNFGFSGNGKTEVEVVRFLAEIDAAVFVLDCMANMGAVPVKPNTIAVVKLLREKRPQMPILLLEERTWSDGWILPSRADNQEQRRAELRAAYDELVAGGVKDLHYMKGDDFVGRDDEGTVDGSHPNDLGMMRYADALEPELRKLIPT
jgi:hypothetical protein